MLCPKCPPVYSKPWVRRQRVDLSQWLEVIVVEYAVRRDEYREVLSRLDILEHDVADVKDRLDDLHP